MASAVPQEASEARSAGHGAKASGIEARQGVDSEFGKNRTTRASPQVKQHLTVAACAARHHGTYLAVADATGGSGRDFKHKVRTGCTTNGH